MILLVVGWGLLGGLCVWLALNLPVRQALQTWAGVTAVACVLGAFAIASQPLGQATLTGRLGSIVLRWGFKESQGRLPVATIVSWLVWVGIGAAAIALLRARGDWTQRTMILAWTVDAALLAYVVGVWLASGSGRAAPSLLVVAAVLVAMIAGSAVLWSRGPEGAKRMAVVLAGGPPLLIGVGYGLFLLVVLTVGRNTRWN